MFLFFIFKKGVKLWPIDISKVGVGQDVDPEKTVKKALEQSGEPDLTIVFSSSPEGPHKVYEKIRSHVGQSTIIGGTTAGEYSSAVEKPQSGTVAVMTLKSRYLKVGIGVGENLKEKPFEAGKKAVLSAYEKLQEDPTAAALISVAFMKKKSLDILKMKPFINIVLPDGLSGQEESFLRGIVTEIGSTTPIVGGSTGDLLEFKETYQFANGVYTNSGVVATLETSLKVGLGYGHPYYPTKRGAEVTKASGRTVYELNGRPAVEVLKEILQEEELNPDVFARKPLGVRSTDIFGEYMIKSAMRANEDGSVTFYSEVPEGSFLTAMETNPEYAISAFEKALRSAIDNAGNPKKIGAVIIFNCILRHLLKERLCINDLDIIREVIGNVPMIGFNTYGEQGATKGGAIGHFNQTSTILVIGDELISQG